MTDRFVEHVALFRRRLGMYVLTGSFTEVCAFIGGLNMGSEQHVTTVRLRCVGSVGADLPPLTLERSGNTPESRFNVTIGREYRAGPWRCGPMEWAC